MSHTLAHRSQRAFTLIEILIAMFVAAIVIALVATGLVTGFRSSERSSARQKATEQVDSALRALRADIGAAQAADRAGTAAYDPIDLATALSQGTPLIGADGTTGAARELDVRELALATPDALVIELADASRNRSCVEWRADRGSLVRRASPLAAGSVGCAAGGASGSEQVLVRPAGDGAVALDRPFRYVVAVPRGDGTCAQQVADGPLDAVQRARVLSIVAAIDAKAGARNRAVSEGRDSTFPLRSRTGPEYQRAIGCAS